MKRNNLSRFHYLDWGKTASQKALLCLHGYADTARLFTPLATILGANFRVIALDLPMVHEARIFSIGELADYVEEFCTKIGLKKFLLVGFSLGGWVATEYCFKYPGKAESLFLLNSLPSLFSDDKSKARGLYKNLKPLLVSKPILYLCSKVNNHQLVKKLLSLPPLSRKASIRIKDNYRSIFGTLLNNLDFSRAREFNDLFLPKKIVLFKDDEILRWHYVKNRFKNFNGKLQIFGEGGHATKKTYWPTVAKLLK